MPRRVEVDMSALREEYARQLQDQYDITVHYDPHRYVLIASSACGNYSKSAVQVHSSERVQVAGQLIEMVAEMITNAAN